MKQEKELNSVVYTRVPVLKVAIMMVLTICIYSIPWVYRNWKVYRQKEGQDISPVLRTIFFGFICIPMFRSICNSSSKAVLLCLIYWAPSILSVIFTIVNPMYGQYFGGLPLFLFQVIYATIFFAIMQAKINSQSSASDEIKKYSSFGVGSCIATFSTGTRV